MEIPTNLPTNADNRSTQHESLCIIMAGPVSYQASSMSFAALCCARVSFYILVCATNFREERLSALDYLIATA